MTQLKNIYLEFRAPFEVTIGGQKRTAMAIHLAEAHREPAYSWLADEAWRGLVYFRPQAGMKYPAAYLRASDLPLSAQEQISAASAG